MGLCLLLIPRYGMMGAAVATAVALTLESALLLWITTAKLGLSMAFWGRTVAA